MKKNNNKARLVCHAFEEDFSEILQTHLLALKKVLDLFLRSWRLTDGHATP